MNHIIITIPGKPIAKKRPRFSRRGKFVVTYNDQETEEGKFIALMVSRIKDHKPIEAGKGIKLICRYFMPIPQSVSKKQRALMEGCVVPYTKKPDLDNLVKFTKDCANGILWHDDSQIISLIASKAYHPNPATEIQIFWD